MEVFYFFVVSLSVLYTIQPANGQSSPSVTTEVPSSSSIRVTFIQPSDSLAAESYDIQYTRVIGAGQELCPDRDSPDDTMTFTGVTSPYDITSLQEFSTYDITVTAVFSDAMQQTTVQNTTTLVAAPTAAPRDLMSTTVLSTSITVGWDSVECIERNGVIDNYIVLFRPEGGVQNNITIQSEAIDQPGTYTASGLIPSTRYSFEVAAETSAGRGPFTAPLIVTTNAVSPPTGLTAVQSGLTSVLVSWTAPASDSSVITGYRITYSTGGGSVQSVDVGAGATSRTLTGLQSGATYSISIVALINTTSSSVEGPTIIIVREFLPPTVMTEVLSPTSIRVTFTQPSGSLPVERHDIQYSRVTGAGQAECSRVTGSGSVIDVPSPNTITNLEEFSAYNIAVTVHAFNEMRTTTQREMTSSAVPSESPQSVVVSSVTSSSITVQWGRVRCIVRNSVITGYTVRYGQTGSTTATMTVSGTGISNRMFTANGLLPQTSYTFEVAAVSNEGTGPFSTGTIVETAVPEGVALHLSGQRYSNNSLVTLTDIGEGDSAALLCLTDREQCCRNGDNDIGGALGEWYYPNNSSVLLFGFTGASIFQNRGASRVRLNRRNNAQSPTGLYHCEVPDANGINQSIYVGLYLENDETPTISAIQFELTSATNAPTISFNLHCITMGGPVDFSDITWTRGSSLPASHGLFQALVNGSTATYNNTLAVVGRETGQYICQLQPPGGNSLTRMINVGAANPPSGLMAVQSGPTSVDVSWTAPASATRTGYCIFYETGGSEQSVDVGAAGATSHTLTGLQSGATYSISIVALSNTLPSTVLGPVTIDGYVVPTATTQVLGPTSITVTFTQPSGPPAESYDIQYTRVVGAGQELCPDRESPDDTMTVTGVTSPYNITNLQEFSTYNITVTAVFSGGMVPKTVQNTTLASAPTATPQNLMSTTVLSTSITVGWNPVECIERNGVIDNYIVRFGPEGGAQSESIVQSEDIDQPGTYTASGLTPSTRYSFEVAAETSAGRGPFTAQLIVTTNAVSPPTGLTAVQSGLTSVNVSWTAPASDSSVITGYRIINSTGGGSEQSVDVGTSATSHTLTGLQSRATYSISIVALIDVRSSSVEGPVMVFLQEFLAPLVTTEVLGPSSIRVTFTQPSDSLAAERYDIQYTRDTVAGQAECPEVTGSGSATDMQSSITITNLEEFSTYNIAVIAHAFSEMRTTTEQEITSPAVPSGPPQSVVMSSVTSSSITVQWDRVECIDRNSVITGYTVRYGQTGSTTANMTVSGTDASNKIFTASGLLPRTSYTFEVAAVSNEGTGPFSTGTTGETAVPEGVALHLSGQRYGNNSLLTLTDIGEGDSAALLCLTDREQCCRSYVGQWYYPNNGSALLFGYTRASIITNHGASRVRLNRRNNAQSPTGLYCCEVPDANGMNQNIYVGLYLENDGAPTVDSLTFAEPSLTCTSSGGPASSVTWTRNGVTLDVNGSEYQQTQTVTNVTTATYETVLTNSDPSVFAGPFSCNVSNTRGSDTGTISLVPMPQVTVSSVDTAHNGTNYTLTCAVTLNTGVDTEVQVTRTWQRGTVQILPGSAEVDIAQSDGSVYTSSLSLEPLDSGDEGMYTCHAEVSPMPANDLIVGNSASSTPYEVDVLALPRPGVSIMIVRDGACSQVSTLTCAVEVVENLFSPPAIEWMSPGGTPISQSGSGVSLGDVQGLDTMLTRTLIFTELTAANMGQYTCRASINIELAEIEGHCNEISTPVVPNAIEVGVQELRCGRLSDNSLRLVWSEVSEGRDSVVGYRVEVQEIQQLPGSRELVTVPLPQEFDEMNAGTTIDVSQGLEPSVPYEVSVTPLNSAGCGVVTEELTCFTREGIPRTPVVTFERLSDTTLIVSWEPLTVVEARGFLLNYRVVYSPIVGSRRKRQIFGNEVLVPTDQRSVVVNNLEPLLRYEISVTASTSAGTSTAYLAQVKIFGATLPIA